MRSLGQSISRPDLQRPITEEQQAEVNIRREASQIEINAAHLPQNMSADMASRIEARRQAEANFSGVDELERVDIYKREIKNSITWNAIILVLFILRGLGQNAE